MPNPGSVAQCQTHGQWRKAKPKRCDRSCFLLIERDLVRTESAGESHATEDRARLAQRRQSQARNPTIWSFLGKVSKLGSGTYDRFNVKQYGQSVYTYYWEEAAASRIMQQSSAARFAACKGVGPARSDRAPFSRFGSVLLLRRLTKQRRGHKSSLLSTTRATVPHPYSC